MSNGGVEMVDELCEMARELDLRPHERLIMRALAGLMRRVDTLPAQKEIDKLASRIDVVDATQRSTRNAYIASVCTSLAAITTALLVWILK